MFGDLDGNKQYILSYHIVQSNDKFKPKFNFLYSDGTMQSLENNGDLEYDLIGTSIVGKTIVSIGISWSTQTQGGIVTFSNIMLREVNTDDTFIEHEEQTITFPLKSGQVLRKRRLSSR